MGVGTAGQLGVGSVSNRSSFEAISFQRPASVETKPKDSPKTNSTETKKKKLIFAKKNQAALSKKEDIFFDCGSNFCTAIVSGNVFVWGSVKSISSTLNLVGFTPNLFSDLTVIQVKQVVSHSKHIFIVVGLHNLPNITFSSFNPPTVEYGTAQGIVDFMFESFNESFLDIFFYCYPLFLKGKALLELIGKKWKETANAEDPTAQKTKIIVFVEKWIKSKQNYDVFDKENIFDVFHKLVEEIAGNNMLQTKLLRLLATENNNYKLPPPSEKDLTSLFFELPPKEVAEQICLVEQYLFSTITTFEFLGLKWQKSKENATNLLRVIQSFNNFSGWCMTTILQSPSQKVRSERANKWLLIAEQCLKLNNFNAIMWITCIFSKTAITKLIKADELRLKTKSSEILEQITKLSDDNYKEYRKIVLDLAENNAAGIPYLAIHLTDLTFLEEMKLYRDEMINWKKCSQISVILRILDRLPRGSFPFVAKELYPFLFYVKGLDDDLLYSLSSKILEGGNVSNMVVSNVIPASPLLSQEKQENFTESVLTATFSTFESFRRKVELQAQNSKKSLMEKLVSNFGQLLGENKEEIDIGGGHLLHYRDAFNRTKAFEHILTYFLLHSSELGEEEEEKKKMRGSLRVGNSPPNLLSPFATPKWFPSFKSFFRLVVGANMREEQVENTLEFLLQISLNPSFFSEDQISFIVNSLSKFKFYDSSVKLLKFSPIFQEAHVLTVDTLDSLLSEISEFSSILNFSKEASSFSFERFQELNTRLLQEATSRKQKLEALKKEKDEMVVKKMGEDFLQKEKLIQEEMRQVELQEKELLSKLAKLQERKSVLKKEIESTNSKMQDSLKISQTQMSFLNNQIFDTEEEARQYEAFYDQCYNCSSLCTTDFSAVDFISNLKSANLLPVLHKQLPKLYFFLQSQKASTELEIEKTNTAKSSAAGRRLNELEAKFSSLNEKLEKIQTANSTLLSLIESVNSFN